MKRNIAPVLSIIVVVTTALIATFWFASATRASITENLVDLDSPTITILSPSTAPNDLDTPIFITGTGFVPGLTVTLGSTILADSAWASATLMMATVPWGLEPGVYSLTVQNPGGETAILPNAFTVTQGIGVWTSNGPYGGAVSQIVVHPRQPDTVIALGHDVGVFISADAARRWEMAFRKPSWHDEYSFDAADDGVIYVGDDHGLYRTLDGALTWENISLRPNWWEHTPAAHPALPGVVYAATGSYLNPGEEGGVFRSEDYGSTPWITLTVGVTDTHFTSLAIHPAHPQMLAAGTIRGNIYYSLDGGQTWDWCTRLIDTVAALYFNPYEPLQIWATTGTTSGKDIPGEIQTLYKSEDWLHWEIIDSGAGLYADGRFGWDLDFAPGMIWATSVGTYLSTDGGENWVQQPEGPCGATNWLALDPTNPLIQYAGGTLGACKSEDGGLTWQQVNQGLAALIPQGTAVSPMDPDTVYVRAPGLHLARSDNGGQAWRVLDIGLTPPGLALDAFIPGRLYVNNLLSTDSGETFSPMTFTLPIPWSTWVLDGVSYYGPHPRQPGRILAGVGVSVLHTHNGLLYASDDHGANWYFNGPTQPISSVVGIAYDALDPNLIYVATGNTGLWISADGGKTWTNTVPLEDFTEIWQVFAHPETPGNVYIFVRQPPHGAFKLLVSYDAGETWAVLPDGPGGPFYFAPTQPASLYTSCFFNDRMYLCRSWDGGLTWELVNETQQEITTLSGAADGERVVLYVGTKGGQVASVEGMLETPAPPFGSIPGLGNLMGAGVYRLTILLPSDWLYLPLVRR